MHRRTCIFASIIAFACLASVPAPSRGCVADVFTLDRLATQSAYVVTAAVSKVRSYWTPDHMTIETEVTLTGVDRITRDGATPEPDITYTVIGGTVGDATLRVCCAPELKVGDRWVLFLLREYHQNPVLGMERGMFRIAQTEGAPARVQTNGGEPIVAIKPDGAIAVSGATQTQVQGADTTRRPRSIRGGVIAVRVTDRQEAAIEDRAAPRTGLTLDEFLAQVRLRLPDENARGSEARHPIEIAQITPALTPQPLRSTVPREENPEGVK